MKPRFCAYPNLLFKELMLATTPVCSLHHNYFVLFLSVYEFIPSLSIEPLHTFALWILCNELRIYICCSTFLWLHRCNWRTILLYYNLWTGWFPGCEVQGNGKTWGWIWILIQAGRMQKNSMWVLHCRSACVQHWPSHLQPPEGYSHSLCLAGSFLPHFWQPQARTNSTVLLMALLDFIGKIQKDAGWYSKFGTIYVQL